MFEKIGKQVANLLNLKNSLITSLNNKGVSADNSEKLNTLIPKVDDINLYSLGRALPTDIGFVIVSGYDTGGSVRKIETVNMITIPSSMFYRVTTLQELVIGQGTKFIRNSACSYLTNLKEIILPNSVTHLYVSCFANCTGLETVYLPNSIIYVDSVNPFANCTALKNFTVESGFNNSLNLSASSVLTIQSAKSIINNFAENSGKTFTVHSSVLEQLEYDEQNSINYGETGILTIARNKGLTVGA